MKGINENGFFSFLSTQTKVITHASTYFFKCFCSSIVAVVKYLSLQSASLSLSFFAHYVYNVSHILDLGSHSIDSTPIAMGWDSDLKTDCVYSTGRCGTEPGMLKVPRQSGCIFFNLYFTKRFIGGGVGKSFYMKINKCIANHNIKKSHKFLR